MHFKRLVTATALAAGCLAAAPALAQDCVGFTDVPAASGFCPNVEWLKNRAITLGCTATQYCPNDAVTRLAMAAFMNRMGTALTATFVRAREPALGSLNLTTQRNVCATAQVDITGYPRTAVVRGMLNAYTPSGGGAGTGMEVKAWIVYSTDNGVTWLNPATLDGYSYGALYEGRNPPDDVTLHPFNVIELAVGTSYRFGVAVERVPGGASTSANLYCESIVELINRNGATSPRDPAPSGVAGGRGD